MTRIDFYILPATSQQDRLLFAIKLINKTCKIGHQIYIHCDNKEDVESLSQLLWAANPHSFLPHQTKNIDTPSGTPSDATAKATHETENNAKPCIEIAHGENAASHHDILINLSSSRPSFFAQFDRLSEIVIQEPTILQSSRDNYRFYQDRHYPLHRHDLRQNA